MLNNKEKLRQTLKEKHIEGQLCQRNWDLTQEMPEEDVQVILHSVTQCPSKQNLDYYSVIAIQDRSIIENIYYNYTLTAMGRKNPQILGQLLLVFVTHKPTYVDRNREIRHLYNVKETVAHPTKGNMDKSIIEDMHHAIGIAGGFANVTATMLGYKTGFNRRFDHKEVHKIIGVPEGDRAVLMLGIGVPDLSRDRKQEHYENAEILSYPKIPINVKRL
tara:strand:+ start:2192 stop:2845 length:654 start_codon:yes stop_codon:yes gene_type:complete